MATLTKDDLDNINTLFTKNFATIWKDNLAPAIDEMVTKNELKDGLSGLEQRMKKDSQDTRDFIAKKVAELGGGSVSRDHGLEKRIDFTDDKLVVKNIFTDQDLQDIKAVPVFGPTSA